MTKKSENERENESDATDGVDFQEGPADFVGDLFKMVAPKPDVTEEEEPGHGAPPRVTGD